MSLKDKMNVIGTIRSLLLGGLIVEVKVLDYKVSWGKERWLVSPVSGSGETWVEADWKA